MNEYLLTPGPVPTTRDVSLAEARELIGHRGAVFSEFFLNLEEKLSKLLRSEGRTVIFPSSGTGALESLAANFTGPDTKVISVSCGVFGDRFREITAQTGARMINIDVEPGSGVRPETVSRAVFEHPGADVLLLTQNETSTGVLNPIDEIIAALPKGERPLVLVDGVSSVGAAPCYPEEWGIDGLATASQKGLLTPPGLGLVWLSERAWDVAAGRKCCSYYFDLVRQRKYIFKDRPENPYTPPVSLYFALDAALNSVLADGWFEGRRRAADALTAGAEALGFKHFVSDKKFRSPGVTALTAPGGDIQAVIKSLREMGLETAGGQGSLKGKLMRIAHYHDVRWPEISLILGSLFAASAPLRNERENFIASAFAVWEGERHER
ncbi:MAG: alanine--glyoxylate aminotransferase family protein [Synergistaceae bacterium]|jgi:aspartate aminotransferase-like enzyme|nr:alanine--glyoxylate aminotransferase family protein [Synergistaceae bacterium]